MIIIKVLGFAVAAILALAFWPLFLAGVLGAVIYRRCTR